MLVVVRKASHMCLLPNTLSALMELSGVNELVPYNRMEQRKSVTLFFRLISLLGLLPDDITNKKRMK